MESSAESGDPDRYRVPAGPAEAELRVKGSRFLARVIPVAGVDEAQERLAQLRRAEHDATHHCSAWRLEPDGSVTRHDDDGEPSGTAGAPILRQIEASGLTRVLVVVTRWYGGTKLGTGGLIRAYGDVAREALVATRVATRTVREPVTVEFAYADTSPAMHVLSRFDVSIRDTVYGDTTRIDLAVRRSQVAAFVDAFSDALRGRGTVTPGRPGGAQR